MSSPLGFVEGGIGVIGVERRPLLGERDLPRDGSGEVGGEEEEGRKSESGQGACMGGVRTFRYMLNDRSALFA